MANMEARLVDLDALERRYSVSVICRSLLTCLLRPYGFLTKEQQQYHDKLLTYIKSIFRVPHADYGRIIDEVLKNDDSDREVVVAVNVIEARALPAMDSDGLADPYCVLTLLNQKKTMRFRSVRHQARLLQRLTEPIDMNRRPSNRLNLSATAMDNQEISVIANSEPLKSRSDSESLLDKLDNVRRTQVTKKTLAPKWNETFFLKTFNVSRDGLILYVFDSDDDFTLSKSFRSIKGAIGCLVFVGDACRSCGPKKKVDDFLGYCKVKLRTIPSTGLEDWFRIKHVKLAHRYHHHNSACKLRIEFLNPEILDLTGGHNNRVGREGMRARAQSIGDVAYWPIDFLLLTWRYALQHSGTSLIVRPKLSLARSRSSTQTPPSLECILAQMRSLSTGSAVETTGHMFEQLLHLFSCAHFVSNLQQKIIRLTAILWLLADEKIRFNDFESALKQSTQDAEEAMWYSSGVCLKEPTKFERSGFTALAKKRVSTLFETVLVSFMRWYFTTYVPSADIYLFPLDSAKFPRTVYVTGIPLRILNVSTGMDSQFCDCDGHCDHCDNPIVRNHRLSALIASEMIVQEIKNDVHGFSECVTHELHIEAKAEVTLEEAKFQLFHMLDILFIYSEAFETSIRHREHFEKFANVDYAVCVSDQLDEDLCPLLRIAIDNSNRYQASVKMNPEAFYEISKQSLDLYFAIKRFTILLHQFIGDHKLQMNDYVEWFQDSAVFWLDTFRDQSRRRLLRALEFDREMIQVTNTSRYSTSTVDVLSVFSKMLEEWNRIYIDNAENTVLGIVKITEFICDGTRLYTEKIIQILEKYGGYDNGESCVQIPDQLCIAMNNIEKVRSNMLKLETNPDFQTAIRTVAERHNRPEFVTNTHNTLSALINDANAQIVRQVKGLEQLIGSIVRHGVEAFVPVILRNPTRSQMDQVVQYLKSNYNVASKWLKRRVRRRVLIQVWDSALNVLLDNIEFGRSPEYYDTILQFCQEIRAYFLTWDSAVGEEVLYTEMSTSFAYSLAYRTKLTTQLGMEFYRWVINSVLSRRDSRGSVNFKIGFVRQVNEISTIIIKDLVLCLDDRELDNELCAHVSVELELLPSSAFTSLAYTHKSFGPFPLEKPYTSFIDSKMNIHRVATTLLADYPNATIAKWLREYQSYNFIKYVDVEDAHDGHAVLRLKFLVHQMSVGKIGSMIRMGSVRRQLHQYGVLVNLHHLREVPAESVTVAVYHKSNEDGCQTVEGECLDSPFLESVSYPVYCWDSRNAHNNAFRSSSVLPNCVMVLNERNETDREAQNILSSAPPFFTSD